MRSLTEWLCIPPVLVTERTVWVTFLAAAMEKESKPTRYKIHAKHMVAVCVHYYEINDQGEDSMIEIWHPTQSLTGPTAVAARCDTRTAVDDI